MPRSARKWVVAPGVRYWTLRGNLRPHLGKRIAVWKAAFSRQHEGEAPIHRRGLIRGVNLIGWIRGDTVSITATYLASMSCRQRWNHKRRGPGRVHKWAKLSTTHEQSRSIQFISNKPTATAYKNKSIASASPMALPRKSRGLDAEKFIVSPQPDQRLEPRITRRLQVARFLKLRSLLKGVFVVGLIIGRCVSRPFYEDKTLPSLLTVRDRMCSSPPMPSWSYSRYCGG